MPGKVHITDEHGRGFGTTDSSGNPAVSTVGETDATIQNISTTQYTPLLGASGDLVALPSGSGKGPDTFIVDLATFSSSDIYLVVICATGTVTHTADVQYSADGTGTYLHPGTADSLWSATAGNLEASVPKKDRFAHIILEQVTGTAEDTWAYVIGRDVA